MSRRASPADDLAEQIAHEASRSSGGLFALRSYRPRAARAPHETVIERLSSRAQRLAVVTDHGAMRAAALMVPGDDGAPALFGPKGPLDPQVLGAAVAAFGARCPDVVTVLDVAYGVLDRLEPSPPPRGGAWHVELLGRWGGPCGAMLQVRTPDERALGPLLHCVQHAHGVRATAAVRAPSGRLVPPAAEPRAPTWELVDARALDDTLAELAASTRALA
jgi:hypothetical protein